MLRGMLKAFLLAIAMMGAVENAYAVREGFALGLQAGAATTFYDSEYASVSGASSSVFVKPNNKGYGMRLYGGYQATYYGVEMGYTYYSPIKYDTEGGVSTTTEPTSRIQVGDLLGKVIYPVWWVSAFGKAGLAGILQKRSGSLLGTGDSSKTVFVRPEVAIGASYDLTQNVVADISWNRIISRGALSSVNFFALGVSYHFVDTLCGQFLC